MRTKVEQNETVASSPLFMIARAVVGVASVLSCLLGGAFTWNAIRDGEQWWWWAVGLALVVCGLWFIWSAVRPRRRASPIFIPYGEI